MGELEQSIQAKHNYNFASAILPLDDKKKKSEFEKKKDLKAKTHLGEQDYNLVNFMTSGFQATIYCYLPKNVSFSFIPSIRN